MSKDFLGRGWRFPIVPDATGGLGYTESDDNVEQSIRILLLTRIGERPMRGSFGTRLAEMVFLPGGTSRDIVNKLQEAITKIVLEPETRKTSLAQGMDSVGNTSAEFTAMYNSEIARWAKVVKALGLEPN